MELSIQLEDPAKAPQLYGPMDRHLKMIREALGVRVFAREGQVKVTGSATNVSRAAAVLEALQRSLRRNRPVTIDAVTEAISAAAAEREKQASEVLDVYVSGQLIKPKTPGQKRWLSSI